VSDRISFSQTQCRGDESTVYPFPHTTYTKLHPSHPSTQNSNLFPSSTHRGAKIKFVYYKKFINFANKILRKMANNERKPGESNKQYLERIKAQKKEQRIQEEINKVKNQEDYGGELEPAVLIAEQNPATISQGYQTVGRRNNDHRVGQKSVFGEREYDPNPSLAQRFGN
jgi:hypothetical protein